MISEHYFIKTVKLENFRGLSGTISLNRGLNIILGPNNSGKTTLLEALLFTSIINYSDVREGLSKILVMEAARGSERHAFESIVPDINLSSIACVKLNNGEESCIEIAKSVRLASQGVQIESIVDVMLTSKHRNCKIIFSFGSAGVGIHAEGNECLAGPLSLGSITSGVLPYNIIDVLVGYIKKSNPEILNKIKVRIGGEVYTIDLGADPWNNMVALVIDNTSKRSIVFYSLGRGVQRAFQISLLAEVSNILLIDEIESAMHPELLADVARILAEKAREKQIIVTTQSREAAVMLASAILDHDHVTGDPVELEELAYEKCDAGSKYEDLISTIVLSRINNEVKQLFLSGCNAIYHLLGPADPRMSYLLIPRHKGAT